MTERVQQVQEYGAEYGWYGENLYRGSDCDIRNIISKWHDSPSHRANLDHEYDSAVILIHRADDGVCYGVMINHE